MSKVRELIRCEHSSRNIFSVQFSNFFKHFSFRAKMLTFKCWNWNFWTLDRHQTCTWPRLTFGSTNYFSQRPFSLICDIPTHWSWKVEKKEGPTNIWQSVFQNLALHVLSWETETRLSPSIVVNLLRSSFLQLADASSRALATLRVVCISSFSVDATLRHNTVVAADLSCQKLRKKLRSHNCSGIQSFVTSSS